MSPIFATQLTAADPKAGRRTYGAAAVGLGSREILLAGLPPVTVRMAASVTAALVCVR